MVTSNSLSASRPDCVGSAGEDGVMYYGASDTVVPCFAFNSMSRLFTDERESCCTTHIV